MNVCPDRKHLAPYVDMFRAEDAKGLDAVYVTAVVVVACARRGVLPPTLCCDSRLKHVCVWMGCAGRVIANQ